MFAVIKGTPKAPRFTKVELMRKYFDMAKKAIDEVCLDATDDIVPNRWALKQFAYCQARYISLSSIEHKDKPHTLDDYHFMFDTISIFKNMLSLLTPTELLQTFPVTKRYNGKKYQCKDYFSTMEVFKELDMDKPFKDQGVDMLEILFNYKNRWLDDIVIHSMLVIDNIRTAKGEDDMITSFFKEQGLKPPRKMTMHKDHGKQFMMDENGKTFKVHKPKPRYLRLVSKGRLHDCVDKKGRR
jgi:hypothetical protein